MADSDDEPLYASFTIANAPCRCFRPANKLNRTLSSHALDALKEFYTERDARAKKFEELQAEAEERAKAAAEGTAASSSGAGSALTYPLSMETFGEDWNESQFWVRATVLFFIVSCFQRLGQKRRWMEVTVADNSTSSGVGLV